MFKAFAVIIREDIITVRNKNPNRGNMRANNAKNNVIKLRRKLDRRNHLGKPLFTVPSTR